ncbi:YncE family protein [Dictyobacter kobayashii]|uniref:YncE family protein n=1 Tax=Dictyobacter kobayashii TaxID=2014872 RepID=A0A402AY80_9CHLR|nr:YncE family protein [Dictyobacter kobayashii]GCE24034.1 hypothetical protein KDK_78340 [Dictyobacter kobayashii]
MKQHVTRFFFDNLLAQNIGVGLPCVIYGLLLCLLIPPSRLPAYADGGAPNLAYVAGSATGISVIDVAQKAISRTITTTGDPHALLLSPDGRYLYVTRPTVGQLAILAASTGNAICTASLPGQPQFLALDVNTSSLYVAGKGSRRVTALDTGNCRVKQTFLAQDMVNGVALAYPQINLNNGQDTQLWATTASGITVFNARTGQTIQSISMTAEPRAVAIPPGRTAYVTTGQGTINAIDINNYHSMLVIAGGAYGPMDFDESTGEVYVPDARHDQLDVLSPVAVGYARPHEPERTWTFASPPSSVAITNDGQLGFVALAGGQVVMLDLPGQQTITMLHVGGSPHFIITGLYPPLAPNSPQEATLSGILVTIGAYGLIAVMLIAPTGYFLYKRSARRRKAIS